MFLVESIILIIIKCAFCSPITETMHSIEERAEYLSFIGAFYGITMFERLWGKCIQILYQFPMGKVKKWKDVYGTF